MNMQSYVKYMETKLQYNMILNEKNAFSRTLNILQDLILVATRAIVALMLGVRYKGTGKLCAR